MKLDLILQSSKLIADYKRLLYTFIKKKISNYRSFNYLSYA